jgi:hypothetical protein
MGTGYVRNDTSNNIADASVINASDLDGEFDALLAAFNSSTGHTHDGTTAEGAAVTVVGPAQDYVGAAGDFSPKTDSTYDLGKTAVRWAVGYLDDLQATTGTITTLTTELDAIVSTSDLPIAKGGTGAGTASGAITNLGITATAAELNILDGVTATATELNYNDVTTLGSSEASKVVTADASNVVTITGLAKSPSYEDTVVSLTGTTPAVDLSAGGEYRLTTSGNTTFTVSNPPADDYTTTKTLRITQGGTAYTVTFWAGIETVDGETPAAPALNETKEYTLRASTVSGTTIYVLTDTGVVA